MLKLKGYIIYTVLVTILHNHYATQAKYIAATEMINQTDITDYNQSLLTDLQWLFEGLANVADIVENYLPELSADQKNREVEIISYDQLLSGMKYLLTGIKDISKSVVKSLSQREARQFQLFPITSSLIQIMEYWFRQLRLWFARILEMYNHYLPELMLGKCVGKYLILNYPNHAFYEYPYLIIYDVFAAIAFGKEKSVDTLEFKGEEVSNLKEKEEHFVEQNEIIDNDLYDFPSSTKTTMSNLTSLKPKNSVEPADLGRTDEEMLQDDVAKLNSWPKCLKLYTAETIFRNLEFYFFS